MVDVIIVGGGPAGVSAAIYLKRLKKEVLLISKDTGTLGRTGHIENYYGIVEPISGADLFQIGIAQAKRMGIMVFEEEVLDIDYGGSFVVKTNQGRHEAKAVLLATGASRSSLHIKGFDQFLGKGISHCAVCDGFLYRTKRIGIVGNGPFMKEELDTLKQFAGSTIVFTNGIPLSVELDKNQEVIDDRLVEFQGDDQLSFVKTENETIAVDALFVAVGTPSATSFALRMGAYTDQNNLVVDKEYMTNIPGLFAAGDCIGGLLQIAKAVSDGAHAALSINKYLRQLAE